MILIGWKAAPGRSALAALDLTDVRVELDVPGHEGLTITLDRSKTDQTASGVTVWIAGADCRCATIAPTTTSAARTIDRTEDGETADSTRDLCPAAAWRAWPAQLESRTLRVRRGPAWQPVDRHDQLRATRLGARSIADTIAARATAIGLPGDWCGHSIRRGFATEAYAHGNTKTEIMRDGRWKTASTMRGYLDEGTRMRTSNPSSNPG